jgi:hypothetical protein
MRKLKLDIEQLEVESFSVTRDTRAAGTVHGHAEATYGCTEGYAGCAADSVGDTCNVLCSHTHVGTSCDYVSCEGYHYCPPDWTVPETCAPAWTIDDCPGYFGP